MRIPSVDIGALLVPGGGCRFRVWAPSVKSVEVHILAPEDRLVPLTPTDDGYHEGLAAGVAAGALYYYRLDARVERPDPASRFQPFGVHKPSQVVGPISGAADRAWFGRPLADYVLYELHVGAFTDEGTFDAIIPHLDHLADLGITALELMPIAQFPGARNWGYDGVHPFAPQNTYGGPGGLRRLIDACHERGLAVVLDVVYNHLGPEGNYLAEFGPYFTDAYRTPWGPALNFDGPSSDEVRSFFTRNALYWMSEFGVDALRLDAIHAIKDGSARPFLAELSAAARARAGELNRRFYLIAESNLNDPRILYPPEIGGAGLDAQWCDDFHHALHTLVTGESDGYYADFGRLDDLAKAYRESFVFTGQYSRFRKRRHGRPTSLTRAGQYVVSAQNHDQVGNRMRGERLSTLADFETLKLVAVAVLLSPFLPLLFMGEEYGETAPFPYFVSHSDPQLVEAVRRGRRDEFASFRWAGEPPDPQSPATFLGAKLRHDLGESGQGRTLWELHRALLQLRRELPALAELDQEALDVLPFESEQSLCLRRSSADQVFLLANFSRAAVVLPVPALDGRWQRCLDTADLRWAGPGSPAPEMLEASDGGKIGVAPRAACLFVRES